MGSGLPFSHDKRDTYGILFPSFTVLHFYNSYSFGEKGRTRSLLNRSRKQFHFNVFIFFPCLFVVFTVSI